MASAIAARERSRFVCIANLSRWIAASFSKARATDRQRGFSELATAAVERARHQARGAQTSVGRRREVVDGNRGHQGLSPRVPSNHLRAVAGLALGSCAARGPSRMVNLIGGVPSLSDLSAIPGAHVHLYGKEARPGRKVGHVTLVETECPDPAGSARRLEALVRACTSG